MDKLKTSLAQLQLRAATVSDKRAAAEAALIEATVARDRYALEGDLSLAQATEKLQRGVDNARSTLDGWATAMTKLLAEIAAVEQQIAAEQTAIERKAASEGLARDLDDFEKALPVYLNGARRIVASLDAFCWHFESVEMGRFIASTVSQVEVASAFTLQELQGMVKTIRDGTAPIPPKKPEPAPVVTVEQPPPVMTVFMLKSAHYRNHEGRKQFGGQWEDVTMPLDTARKAMRHGIAVSTADPRRKELRGIRGGDFRPGAPDVVDIDAIEEHTGITISPIDTAAVGRPVRTDPITGVEFFEVNRGPALVGLARVSQS